MRKVRVRPVIATLLLATALTTFGCRTPLREGTIMGDKPKQGAVLRDVQEEAKPPKQTIKALPVPQKKEEVKEETKKGTIEKTPEGTVITTEWGLKILKRNDGSTEILERPRKKPIDIERIH